MPAVPELQQSAHDIFDPDQTGCCMPSPFHGLQPVVQPPACGELSEDLCTRNGTTLVKLCIERRHIHCLIRADSCDTVPWQVHLVSSLAPSCFQLAFGSTGRSGTTPATKGA